MSYKSPYALSDEDKQLIQNKMVEFVTDILRNNKAKSMLDVRIYVVVVSVNYFDVLLETILP